MRVPGLALALWTAAACGDRDAAAPGEEVADTAVQAERLDPGLAALLPPGSTFEEAEEGQRLFLVCTVCHGLDGGGTALGPSLRAGEWIHLDTIDVPRIAALVREGIDRPREYPIPMPAQGGGEFDEGQLRSLATYVYLLSRQTEPGP